MIGEKGGGIGGEDVIEEYSATIIVRVSIAGWDYNGTQSKKCWKTPHLEMENKYSLDVSTWICFAVTLRAKFRRT
jgi:hypothetical protein